MFRWADYLALAKELAQRGPSSALSDACFRSAISRAYYAALLTVRNWLRDQEGIEPRDDAGIHADVPDFLSLAGVEEADRLASVLRRLRGRRSDADYQDQIGNPRKLAELSLLEAGEVVSAGERFTSD